MSWSGQGDQEEILDLLNELVHGIPLTSKIFISRDLNWHVEKDRNENKRVHEGQDIKNSNNTRDIVLDFVLANNFRLINNFYGMRRTFRVYI